MALLVFTFFSTSVITFGIVMFFLRQSPEQKAVGKRLVAIKAKQGDFAEVNDNLVQYFKTEQSGSFGWLEELFENSSFTRKMQVLIVQSDRKTTVGTVMGSSVGVGLGAFAAVELFTGMLIVAVLAGGIGLCVPIGLLRFRRARRIAAFNGTLADCIDMMARSLRAGHSMIAAVGIVAEQAAEPARSEFAEVFKKQNFGLPLRDALMQLLDRVPSQDLRVLVTGMLVQKDTGGNLAEILDRIVAVIRERIRIQGEIKTHTAQGRMTGWILCLLPVVMLLLINMVNPGYSDVLFHDPMGQKMLYGGIVLLGIGAMVIRGIVNGIEV